MLYRNLLLVLLFLMVSCQNKEASNDKNLIIKTFKSPEKEKLKALKGEKFNYPSIEIPNGLILSGKDLIISELKGDTVLHIVDGSSLAYKSGVGKAGDGPGEIYKVWNLFPSLSTDKFWAYTPEQKRITLFEKDKVMAVAQHYQKTDNALAVQYAPLADQNFIGVAADGEAKFTIYSEEGKILSQIGSRKDYPLDADIPVNVVAYVYQATLKSNKGLTKFAMASLNGDVLEVLDLKDSTILSIRGPIHQIPDVKIDDSAGYPMGLLEKDNEEVYCYLSCSLGEKYVYGLFSGDIRAEVQKHTVSTGKYIYQFDYEGQFINAYELDTTIDDFAVDESKDLFYGVSNDENPGLVRFQL